MSLTCQSCLPVDCLDNIANLPDLSLYNLNEGQMFFNDRFCFVMSCPPGYRCTGPYPRTICIDPGTLPPIVINPSGQISIICCKKPLFAQIPAGANQSQINNIVHGLQLQCADQQAICINNTTGPGSNPPPVPTGNPGTGSTPRLSGSFATACVGSTYFSSVRVSGGGGSILFNLVSGTIPPGLFPMTSTDGQSLIVSGTPSQAGVFTFTISATAQDGTTVNQTFTIRIMGISNPTLPPALINTPYSYQLSAAGGTAPYTFTVAGPPATLPPDGIRVSSSGLINGTPTQAGVFPFVVVVTDFTGFSCQQAVSLTSNAVGNSAISQTSACPGDPSNTASVTIPANTFGSVNPGDQVLVDIQANNAMFNQIAGILTRQGCGCTVTITGTPGFSVNAFNPSPGNQILHFTCATSTLLTSETGNLFAAPLDHALALNGNVDIQFGLWCPSYGCPNYPVGLIRVNTSFGQILVHY